jgi:hypothetical protein
MSLFRRLLVNSFATAARVRSGSSTNQPLEPGELGLHIPMWTTAIYATFTKATVLFTLPKQNGQMADIDQAVCLQALQRDQVNYISQI